MCPPRPHPDFETCPLDGDDLGLTSVDRAALGLEDATALADTAVVSDSDDVLNWRSWA